MNLLILTTSPFYGGPERQMIGLAETFSETNPEIHSWIGSLPEQGKCRPFLEKAAEKAIKTLELKHDFPHLFRASGELRNFLTTENIDIILASGHKARCVAWLAARNQKTKVIGISRGWTDENWKIRCYTAFDRWLHRKMVHIVAVSEGQAEKVRLAGIPKNRISVIRNAIQTDRFSENPDTKFREELEHLFPEKPQFLLGAAGRFSPEKGFDILVDAFKILKNEPFSVGLVIFGDGFLRETLRKQISDLKMENFIKIPGFTDSLDKFLPNFDIFIQSSHSEGLPNVLLESMAAQTAVVATDVGGTGEVVKNGETGVLVSPDNSAQLSEAIQILLKNPAKLPMMGKAGKERVEQFFTFKMQAKQYCDLFSKYSDFK